MKRGLIGFLAGISVLLGILPAHAQSEIVLTLAVPTFSLDIFETDIIPAFEQQNPGVRVHLVGTDNFGSPFNSTDDIDTYLDDVASYVSTADVLPINSADLTSEATRAGYLLDLSAFINADATLNFSDFYTAVWQSFQWDGGHWAMPIAADAVFLFYDPAAFDAAGLSYPTADWTLSDLDFAVRRLAEFDASGATTRPGLVAMNAPLEALAVSLAGHSFTDPATFPAQPDFSDPNLAAFLDTWLALQKEGYLTPNFGSETVVTNPLELSRATFGGFRFGRGGGGGPQEEQESTTVAAMLPGGGTGLIVDGFAISAGTRYPEAAYTLIKFISENQQAANAFITGTPVRRSQQGTTTETQGGPGGGPQAIRLGTFLDDATQALLIEAMESGTPTSEWQFANVVDLALSDMLANNADAATTLDNLIVEQIDRLAVADGRYPAQVIVAEPPVEVALAAGEIELNFAVVAQGGGPGGQLQNSEAWTQAAQAFAESDPQVGRVNIEGENQQTALSTLAETYDCFYGANNLLDGESDLSMLISLDPLFSTDSSFNINDIVNGTLSQLQKDGMTYGLPISVQPLVMRYNQNLFDAAGAYAPYNGWTVADFEQALRTLQSAYPDNVPFEPRDFGGTYLYLLIAAYGGLPIDYRTTPPTLNFTDSTSVEAIRQVLNLVNDGLITYSSLFNAGGAFVFRVGGDGEDLALYSQSLNSSGGLQFIGGGGPGGGAGGQGGQAANADSDPLVLFPAGTTYNGVAYGVSAAHISASTQNVEPCYRFIRSLMSNTDLISSMPATRSLLNDSTFAASQSESALAFYQQYDTMMGQMNTVVFPSVGAQGLSLNTLDTFWLGRVFDEYIAAEGDYDLETELAEAQTFTLAYRDCTAGLPAFDIAQDDPFTYINQVIACAVKVDPDAAQFLPMFGN